MPDKYQLSNLHLFAASFQWGCRIMRRWCRKFRKWGFSSWRCQILTQSCWAQVFLLALRVRLQSWPHPGEDGSIRKTQKLLVLKQQFDIYEILIMHFSVERERDGARATWGSVQPICLKNKELTSLWSVWIWTIHALKWHLSVLLTLESSVVPPYSKLLF